MFQNLEKQDGVLNLFDLNKVDGNHLERIRKGSNKVINIIKRYFPNEEDFNKYLMAQLN